MRFEGFEGLEFVWVIHGGAFEGIMEIYGDLGVYLGHIRIYRTALRVSKDGYRIQGSGSMHPQP